MFLGVCVARRHWVVSSTPGTPGEVDILKTLKTITNGPGSLSNRTQTVFVHSVVISFIRLFDDLCGLFVWLLGSSFFRSFVCLFPLQESESFEEINSSTRKQTCSINGKYMLLQSRKHIACYKLCLKQCLLSSFSIVKDFI